MSEQPSRARRAAVTGGGVAATLAVAVPLIIAWEGGLRRDGSAVAYADRLAHGLPTACAGVTGNDLQGHAIVPGQRFTAAECDQLLSRELRARLPAIQRCLPANMPAEGLGASLSLAYNIGTVRFCHSTASARFRAGNYRGGCDALTAYNRASGRIVRGLVRRREAEKALCLRGAPL